MTDNTKLPEKIFQYLMHLFDTSTTYDIHEFLSHSEMHREIDYGSSISDSYKLFIIVNPEIFKKYQGRISQFEKTISAKLYQFSRMYVSRVTTFPDLKSFQILENRITTVITPWQEINEGQNHLLKLQRTAKETIDFQNIGNGCRTLMQKLAGIVFNPAKHISEDKNIDLSEGKFKNRLHTYIRVELAGSENKELRDYALSMITTAEKAIDLANKVTHDLNATPLMAESCVISTVTIVSIIKLIAK